MKLLKFALILWVLATVPITLFAIGWGIRALFLHAPLWVSVVVYASIITTALSIAHLIDEERRRSGYRGR